MAHNKPYMIEGKITKHFAAWEFCNEEAQEEVKLIITPEFIEHVQMLEELRQLLGYSMDVSSGFRTPTYNAECDGSPNSAHLEGLATDITSIPQRDFELVTDYWRCICAIHRKIGGINYYPWGVHLCSDEGRFGNTSFKIRDYRGDKK